jgi:hypothetical protein
LPDEAGIENLLDELGVLDGDAAVREMEGEYCAGRADIMPTTVFHSGLILRSLFPGNGLAGRGGRQSGEISVRDKTGGTPVAGKMPNAA